jgi:hypothetical protein
MLNRLGMCLPLRRRLLDTDEVVVEQILVVMCVHSNHSPFCILGASNDISVCQSC